MDPRFNQAAAPDAFNPYLYAQQSAALSRNQQPNLSANAPEFIPKFSAPLGAADWNSHHPEPPTQTFQQHLPPQMYAPNSRPFPPHQHQQIPFAGPNQQAPRSASHYVYPQQNRSYAAAAAANSHHHDVAPQHNHLHNHYPNYSNNHHAPHVVHHQSHGGPNSYHRGGGSVQNRLGNGPSSVETAAPSHSSGPPQQQTESEQIALDFLDEVMSKLNDNPGLFENHQKKLCELFGELTENHFVLSNVIEMIFEHSINEQNFRYTGARLCSLFDSLDLSPNSTYRNLLVMKMEFQNTEQVPFMQNDQRRVRGTTLFLAELFVQLKRSSDDSRKIVDVARFVLDSIMLLLTKPGPENIKCVCQTLKLSGYELQKEHPTDVEDAINQLKIIAEEQNIQTKRLIQSVVDLFYDNWGRKDQVEIENQIASTSVAQLPDQLPSNYNESAVFYGPDGQIITEEESSFLNENLPSNYPINIDEIIDDDSVDFSDDDDETEMDLEMRMAYKEFIAGGKQEQANKQNNRQKK